MGGPAEHSSSSNSVVGQNLHLAPAPSSGPPPPTESPEKPRGRKRTRAQVSRKPAFFYFLLKFFRSHHLRFRLHH